METAVEGLLGLQEEEILKWIPDGRYEIPYTHLPDPVGILSVFQKFLYDCRQASTAVTNCMLETEVPSSPNCCRIEPP